MEGLCIFISGIVQLSSTHPVLLFLLQIQLSLPSSPKSSSSSDFTLSYFELPVIKAEMVYGASIILFCFFILYKRRQKSTYIIKIVRIIQARREAKFITQLLPPHYSESQTSWLLLRSLYLSLASGFGNIVYLSPGSLKLSRDFHELDCCKKIINLLFTRQVSNYKLVQKLQGKKGEVLGGGSHIKERIYVASLKNEVITVSQGLKERCSSRIPSKQKSNRQTYL